MVRCGAAPWPPLPWKVMSMESMLAKSGPATKPTCPDGWICVSWMAMAKSGFGNLFRNPSSTIAWAPLTTSSAGCPTKISVPRHRSFPFASSVAAPIQEAIWMSWPQACITGTISPASFLVTTVLA